MRRPVRQPSLRPAVHQDPEVRTPVSKGLRRGGPRGQLPGMRGQVRRSYRHGGARARRRSRRLGAVSSACVAGIFHGAAEPGPT